MGEGADRVAARPAAAAGRDLVELESGELHADVDEIVPPHQQKLDHPGALAATSAATLARSMMGTALLYHQ